MRDTEEETTARTHSCPHVCHLEGVDVDAAQVHGGHNRDVVRVPHAYEHVVLGHEDPRDARAQLTSGEGASAEGEPPVCV